MTTSSRIPQREVLIPFWLMSLSVLLVMGCRSAPSTRSASVQTIDISGGQTIVAQNGLGESSDEVIRQTERKPEGTGRL